MYNENENVNLNAMDSGEAASENPVEENTASYGQSNASAGEGGDSVYRYGLSHYQNESNRYDSYQQASGSNTASQNNTSYSGAGTTYQYQQTGYQQNVYANTTDPKEAKRKAKQMRRERKKANGSGFGVKAAKGIAGLVAVAAVSVGSTYASLQIFDTDSSDPVVIQSTNTNARATKVSANSSGNTVVTTDVSSMVSEVMPSVVTISNVGTETYSGFFGQSGTYEYTSSGSGIIVGQSDTELLIVTNHHVISGADTINVTFVDGKEYTADVKGSNSELDIAVIAIAIEDVEEETLEQIKVATLGDSGNLTVGEPAIAIGNSMGYGQSVTTGVISALDREVTVENVTNTLIQTDAAINPGNSGGALLNLAGEVIGINSVKYTSTEVEGMGYAIPISDVMDVINEMMNNETKKKVDSDDIGYLGIRLLDINSSVSESYNMPQGVYVTDVDKGGAAEKAGIKKGDIITKMAGTTITSSSDLKAELEYHKAGSTVEVVVQSPIADGYGYKEKTYNVTLDKKEK